MSWSYVRKLLWNPGQRWGADFLILPACLGVMIWVRDVNHSVLLGLASGVPVLVLREVLYHYLVRRKRGAVDMPPNQRL